MEGFRCCSGSRIIASLAQVDARPHSTIPNHPYSCRETPTQKRRLLTLALEWMTNQQSKCLFGVVHVGLTATVCHFRILADLRIFARWCFRCKEMAGFYFCSASHGELGDNDPSMPIGQVTCPNCLVIMGRVALGLPIGTQVFGRPRYRCPRCDAETIRWIKE